MAENATTLEWKAFGEGVLRPRQPDLAAARKEACELLKPYAPRKLLKPYAPRGAGAAALAEALTEPEVVAEAWEALTVRLGAEALVGDPQRQFLPFLKLLPVKYSPTRGSLPGDTPRTLSDAPLNLETAVALLGCARADVLAAEQTALQAAVRMGPWGVAPPTRVAWILLGNDWPPMDWQDAFSWVSMAAHWSSTGRLAGDACDLVAEAVRQTVRERGPGERYVGYAPRAGAVRHLVPDVEAWCLWKALAQDDARIAPHDFSFGYPTWMADVRVRSLPDVLEAVLAVWGLGFALVDLRGDVVVLGLPGHDLAPVSAPTLTALRKAQIRRFGEVL